MDVTLDVHFQGPTLVGGRAQPQSQAGSQQSKQRADTPTQRWLRWLAGCSYAAITFQNRTVLAHQIKSLQVEFIIF